MASQPAMPTEDGQSTRDIEKLFELMKKYKASDLHLKVGAPPIMRISGKIRYFDADPLTADRIEEMIHEILDEEQSRALREELDLDWAHSIPGVGRYRINAFHQRGSISIAVRRVNTEVPSFEELHLPGETLREIASQPQGLIIVAGVTGSGKSTTIAAMIEYINQNRSAHIVTIEDPIEYLYKDKKSFINQREVGLDVADFEKALRAVVRQDPDVILIGEMRDHETVETALQTAETGHLVFGTLHSSSVAHTVGRILDLFPADRAQQVRQSLAFNLSSVICQKILPSSKQGVGLVPAQEIMIMNSTIRKLIMEGEDKKIEGVMRSSTEDGMKTFNQCLVELVENELISQKTALGVSSNPDQLKMNLKGIYLGEDRGAILG